MPNEQPHIEAQERLGTLILSAFLAVLGIAWCFVASTSASKLALNGPDASLVPFWAGVLLTVLACFVFLFTWRANPTAGDPDEAPLFAWAGEMRVAAIFLVLLGYIIALERVHFAISTFLLISCGLALSGEPLRPRLLVIAAVTTAVLYLVFLRALNVPLPGGRYS